MIDVASTNAGSLGQNDEQGTDGIVGSRMGCFRILAIRILSSVFLVAGASSFVRSEDTTKPLLIVKDTVITPRKFLELVESCRSVEFRNDTIRGEQDAGIIGGNAQPSIASITIVNCVIEQVFATAGIQLSEFSHIRIDSCHFKSGVSFGLCRFKPWSNITITNSRFEGVVAFDKCEFEPLTEVLIDSCYFHNGVNIRECTGKWLFRIYRSMIESGCLIQQSEWQCRFEQCEFLPGGYVEGDFGNTTLWDCNFRGTDFELSTLPAGRSIGTCQGIENLTYKRTPAGLTALRDWYRLNGYRQKEREATFALRRKENTTRPQPIRSLEFVFFDITSSWGMDYGKPLLLVVALLFLMWPIYLFFAVGCGKGNICRVWKSRRTGKEFCAQLGALRPLGRRKHLIVLRLTLLFSLMSAFNIGFREFNFARWIRNITKNEYDLKATGWARPFSGLQALVSVFLFALFLLTYFGRPFD